MRFRAINYTLLHHKFLGLDAAADKAGERIDEESIRKKVNQQFLELFLTGLIR